MNLRLERFANRYWQTSNQYTEYCLYISYKRMTTTPRRQLNKINMKGTNDRVQIKENQLNWKIQIN